MEKSSEDISETSHNETGTVATKIDILTAGGHRQAAALNIIENPLMVSFTFFGNFAIFCGRIVG